jgi:PAS domain S-box-containing protein
MNKPGAEDRLQELAEKFAIVATETGQILYDYDVRTGRIEWTGAIQEITGFGPDEFGADINAWERLVHPDDRARTIKRLSAAIKGSQRFIAEYRLRTKAGSYRHIRDAGVFLKEKSGRGTRMVGTMTDISESKEAEEALENSLSLLRATLESTADGILVVDRKGDVETMNQNFLKMWRVPGPMQKTGKDSLLLNYVLTQLKDPEVFLAGVKKLYAHPSDESYDILEFKDGRVFERYSKPQRVKTKIIGRVWSFRDVTEGRRAGMIRDAVYRISEIANQASSLDDLFRSIHAVISGLMPASNFYIALFDPEARMLSFPYFVDEFDPPPPPQPLGRGLTEYVLLRGESLLADPEKFVELEKAGKVESQGAPSIDWLGVPLKIKERTIGVMVVQTYTEGIRYSRENENILTFVSTQIALAIERKRAEESLKASLHEKEVLLKEIHHRVKNNMQVISSLLNLQARHLSDPAAISMFRESQSRIRSMALVHEKLYQSKDLSRVNFSQYVENLVMYLVHSFRVDSEQILIKTEIGDVALDINTAIPCGLIINELITNALKHAFPDGRKGKITISLRRDEDSRFVLEVRDDGVGFTGRQGLQNTDTLGMQLVTMLVDQLDGTIKHEKAKGTSFVIAFKEIKYKQRI